MGKPLVSILIPVYNRESIIRETIESALNQDYDNIEIIVVDNNSTDKTWTVVCELRDDNSNIKAFRNTENLGPVKNWQRCIEEASGKYAKILWSDDLISRNFVSQTVSYMNIDDVGYVFTLAEIFNSEKNEKRNTYRIGKTGKYSTNTFIQNKLFENGSYPYSPGCAIFRLKDLSESLLIDIPNKIGSEFYKHGIGSDLLIFLIVSTRYSSFYYIEEPLSMFREHSSSISINSSKDGKLALHYMIAKAYFVETYYNKANVLKKMNVDMLFMTYLFSKNVYGVRRISDFYYKNTNYSLDYFYLIKKIFDLKRIYKLIKFLKR